MESILAKELKLKLQPVAVIFTNEKPEDAVQFKEGCWGCVVAMMNAAGKGKIAAFDREHFGCGGGAIGLGLRDTYDHVPGGIEYFLSTGKGEGFPPGEAYKKNPELAKIFADQLPMIDIPYDYVVFKPLDKVDHNKETPQLVIMLANPDQLAALVVLANYDRPGNDNVIAPFSAGCHTIVLIPYSESQKEQQKAVIGILDISARPYVDPDIMSFTVPFKMFLQMEANVPGSFLEKNDWKKIRDRIPN